MTESRTRADLNDFSCIADVYDELVDWAPYKLWVRKLEKRLRRHGLERGDWILDVACGTGLSSLPWLRRGYHVVGVDRSQHMLARASRRALDEGYELELTQQDILDLDPARRFDLALCMHSGLDYLLKEEDLARAFHSLRGCLREGGLLAFDKCLDVPSFYRRSYTDHRRLSCGTADFEYRWDRRRGLMEQHCTVRRTDGRKPAETHVLYHLKATPPDRLHEMLDDAGFETLERVRVFRVSEPGFGIYRAR